LQRNELKEEGKGREKMPNKAELEFFKSLLGLGTEEE
jgi:hypothetical protein